MQSLCEIKSECNKRPVTLGIVKLKSSENVRLSLVQPLASLKCGQQPMTRTGRRAPDRRPCWNLTNLAIWEKERILCNIHGSDQGNYRYPCPNMGPPCDGPPWGAT